MLFDGPLFHVAKITRFSHRSLFVADVALSLMPSGNMPPRHASTMFVPTSLAYPVRVRGGWGHLSCSAADKSRSVIPGISSSRFWVRIFRVRRVIQRCCSRTLLSDMNVFTSSYACLRGLVVVMTSGSSKTGSPTSQVCRGCDTPLKKIAHNKYSISDNNRRKHHANHTRPARLLKTCAYVGVDEVDNDIVWVP